MEDFLNHNGWRDQDWLLERFRAEGSHCRRQRHRGSRTTIRDRETQDLVRAAAWEEAEIKLIQLRRKKAGLLTPSEQQKRPTCNPEDERTEAPVCDERWRNVPAHSPQARHGVATCQTFT